MRALDGVKIADAARAPVSLDGAAPADMGHAPPAALPAVAANGTGQIVAVADTGLDTGVNDGSMHRDFAGRVLALMPWPLNPSWLSLVTGPGTCGPDLASGHGTHVAGLAMEASGTRLVFQALEHRCEIAPAFSGRIATGYYLAGRPLDLRDLFHQARDLGARIHVNAWGDAASGAYTDDCYEADLFLHENPDAVILFAAGNDGADRDGDGVLDAGSLYAPASAKNVIAIGAAEGPAGRAWPEPHLGRSGSSGHAVAQSGRPGCADQRRAGPHRVLFFNRAHAGWADQARSVRRRDQFGCGAVPTRGGAGLGFGRSAAALHV